jgi:ATP-dependent Clp protease adapter protein ClpS
MSSEDADLSKKRFVVRILEVHEVFVQGDEFAGGYTKTVSLSDGNTHTVELTPMVRDGLPVVEIKGVGALSYMGTVNSSKRCGRLMVQVADYDAVRAEWHLWVEARSGSRVLPPDTSLMSMPEFVPPGFVQGVEILNDNTTTMKFVADLLSTHLGLSAQDSKETMLAIHRRGGALIPTASSEAARQIAAEMTAEAAMHGYPLVCRAVSIGQ